MGALFRNEENAFSCVMIEEYPSSNIQQVIKNAGLESGTAGLEIKI